jgi:hypothetical protein
MAIFANETLTLILGLVEEAPAHLRGPELLELCLVALLAGFAPGVGLRRAGDRLCRPRDPRRSSARGKAQEKKGQQDDTEC